MEYTVEREQIKELYGYKLIKETMVFPRSKVVRYVVINPDRVKDNRYQRGVYQHGFQGEIEFTIDTTSYGSMKAEEIEKMVNEYNKALEVVKAFEKEVK